MPTNSSPGQAPPSFEKRLPLALALMMLVLVISQYIFKPAPGPKPITPVNDNAAGQLAQKPAAQTEAIPSVPAVVGAGLIQAQSEVPTQLDTDLYRIEFTNRGAVVKSWILKKYQDNAGKQLQLIDLNAKGVPLPFSIETAGGQKLTVDPNAVLYQSKLSPDGLGINFEYSDGKTRISKSFRFSKDSYQTEVRSEVTENNTPVPHFLMWRGGFGDQSVHNPYATEHTVYYDSAATKLKTDTAKDAKNGPVTNSGDYTFAGLEDNFFAAVALPQNSDQVQIRTYSDQVKPSSEDKELPYVGDGISTGAQNDFALFVGPKDIEILKSVNPKLSQIVNWGFFGVIAKPLFLWLNWTHDHWTNNYGWAIVLVTIIINLALFPFRLSSLKSARKMQKLQPQIQAINARYKNISLRDPRKAEQNQEIMELYKREGVNPVGGCLPMLVQLPFLYAFYRVLTIAIELRHAPWLWVSDLSAPETLPIHILPVILVITQFATQKLTPAAGVDPNQQRMMMFMPLFFGFMFYYLSSGLVLYYLTGNLIGIAQQLIINRFMPAPARSAPAPLAKAPVKRAGKK